MSQPAIEVSGLSKRYVIQHESRHDNLRDTMHHSARKLWRRLRWGTSFEKEEFWALRDISFSVQPGEVLGIIGSNGAGKSTLLKTLSRITEPTKGKISLRGRIASLLEVGTGFHPELSGRENIYLNGAILGMRRAEIKAKFDEIIAFAEVEQFLDTPVKRYSSGMYVRLAFAVAAHLEPEILIVDEVLAVGDQQFQAKCLGKMNDVARDEGRTVLFVSHNMAAVRRLCQRAIMLKKGSIVEDGAVETVLDAHLRDSTGQCDVKALEDSAWNPPEYHDTLRINKVIVTKADGETAQTVKMEDAITISAHYRVMKPIKSLRFSLHLRTTDEVLVLSSTDADYLPIYGAPRSVGSHVVSCTVPGGLLAPRRYLIRIGAFIPHNKIVAGGDNVAAFEVLETEGPIAPKMLGIVCPRLAWEDSSPTTRA